MLLCPYLRNSVIYFSMRPGIGYLDKCRQSNSSTATVGVMPTKSRVPYRNSAYRHLPNLNLCGIPEWGDNDPTCVWFERLIPGAAFLRNLGYHLVITAKTKYLMPFCQGAAGYCTGSLYHEVSF